MKSCKDESLKHALKQIVQESWSYVISHTRAVFQGKGFLDLPKDMFIGIISSNKVRCSHYAMGFRTGGPLK